jgi:hypothetical protein
MSKARLPTMKGIVAGAAHGKRATTAAPMLPALTTLLMAAPLGDPLSSR